MTTKADFADEEWVRVCRAPFVAGMALSVADPGGMIELSKESMATLRAAIAPATTEELLVSVAADIKAQAEQHHNPLEGFKPTNAATAQQEILDELAAASSLVKARATPEEAAAYDRWLVAAAQSSADAAKEGGFMGVGAVQVSDRERSMLDRIRATLGVP
jgi:hypothetical protein